MNIARMYVIALGSFGYTEDEARFLYLVAAHSGYFTCQQFLRFINGKPNGLVEIPCKNVVDHQPTGKRDGIESGHRFCDSDDSVREVWHRKEFWHSFGTVRWGEPLH